MNTVYNFLKKSFLTAILLVVSVFAYSQKIDDGEIKKNVTSIDNSLNRLIQLEPKIYEYSTTKYKDLKLPSGKQYGFMAENLQTVFPDLVTYRNFSYMAGKNAFRTAKVKEIDVESIIPILVASIKEQQVEIEKLKQEVKELRAGTATASVQ